MENPAGKGPLGKPRRRWNDTLLKSIKQYDGRVWTELIWLKIRTN
jgi:hypothetical protein